MLDTLLLQKNTLDVIYFSNLINEWGYRHSASQVVNASHLKLWMDLVLELIFVDETDWVGLYLPANFWIS